MSAEINGSLPSYPKALHTLNDTMLFSSTRASFEIKKAVLYKNEKCPKSIYLIALRGTNQSLSRNDVLGIPVVLRSSLSMSNIYYTAAKKGIYETIPTGSEIVLTGHSLGGMIAQQLAADKDINASFKVLAALGIGSPFVKTKGRKCPLRRFADKADVIPWLFLSIKANLGKEKPVFKSNGYFGTPVKAHVDSYEKSDSWRAYDCIGELNGGHTIVFDE